MCWAIRRRWCAWCWTRVRSTKWPRPPRQVEVRRASELGQAWPGRVVRQVPAGRDEVPSQALTPTGGGNIATDPRHPKGLRTLDRVFQLDVEVDALAGRVLRYGERVHVRFTHPPAP